MPGLAKYAWAVLACNLGVIAWGAYVRATGSGAGCGAHWPLCNGEVIPGSPTAEMLVEFSHRLTSGLALVSVAVLFAWARRARPRGHPGRTATGWALFFMLTEAGVGAALVLFRLVADNESMARALFMSVHLVNTFLLIACVALAAWWLSGAEPAALRGKGIEAAWFLAGAAALLLAGVSGAVAALGDTLYPSRSLAEALSADVSAAAHILIRLRLLHPVVAVTAGALVVVGGLRAGIAAGGTARRMGSAVGALVVAQVAAGFVNVVLLAPVWMQLVHLLLADLVWLSYVLLGAQVLAQGQPSGPIAALES